MKRSLSLVIAVYNAVRYLEFIFEALRRQSFAEFEVIIADDGSGPAIRELVKRFEKHVDFPIQHLWHEDIGFRKNMMLNNAIRASQSDYLVFIDGDCLPHRHFLRDHWMNKKENGVLCGRRVNLSKEVTDSLTIEKISSGKFEKLSVNLLWDGLMARSYNLEDAIRLNNSGLRTLLHWNRARILGCNFSIEKKLLEQINGFDETYQAPGLGEDSDIDFRLGLIGAKDYSLRYHAVLFHLYHPQTHVGETNKRIYEEVLSRGEAVCRNGLQKPA